MTEPRLTSKERAQLRSQAHGLEPVQHVGAGGLTPAVLKSLREAFNTRELLKVKVLETAPDSAYDTGDQIAERIEGAEVVQTIGRVVVLYRPLPEEDDTSRRSS
ncbi:MAG: YhbY family RNA-binding protein [Gemmatimonadota bacterium]